MAEAPPSSSFQVTPTTVYSFLSTAVLLAAAYAASSALLPRNASATVRFLFVWHAFDGLVHLILEGSYVYNCFFSYTTIDQLLSQNVELSPSATVSPYLPPNLYFLGRQDRIYGSEYGTNPFAHFWMEYSRADKRWAGSDLTIISLEILTVFLGGPIALHICNCLRKESASAWFWMIVLATAELYGGFLTFAPEFLTGNTNLDTSNFMYLYVYLIFFNAVLWVIIPVWVLFQAYGKITQGLKEQARSEAGKKIH
jgi:hypothetical protein